MSASDVRGSDTDMTEGKENASTPAAAGTAASRRVKGRGATEDVPMDDRYEGDAGVFQRLDKEGEHPNAARSIEGWILIVTNVHEECQEEDLNETFEKYGDIKNLHLNLDRRTGFVKGYAFVEYESLEEARAAIQGLNGTELLDQKIRVDWAFDAK
eukprot:GHVU01212961.1.p2 GENE.GHVU01212961.1~~GHVU01212961.1.p2  ORF type:complete len:156 (+),score=33.67 GHVU01212961.1:64-531(+)